MVTAEILHGTIPRSSLKEKTGRVPALLIIFARVIVGVSLAIAPLAAQQEFESLPRNSAIEGVVVKAASGEPLRRATVRLNNLQGGQPNNLSATTGVSGRFLFQNLTPGTYSLYATRPGYIDRNEFDRGKGNGVTTLELRPGEAVRDIAIRLGAAVTISGRIFDEAGEPLNGASVGVMEYSAWPPGQRRLQQVSGGQSNDLGEYRIFGLRPGRYFLYAQYPQQDGTADNSDENGGDQAYAPYFYPGTAEPSAAQRLVVRTGEDLSGIDFTLLPVPAVRVRGQVLNARTGQPPQGAYLTLVPRDSRIEGYAPQRGAGMQDASGSFEFRAVPPGDYYVIAGSAEKEEQFHGRAAVSVGGADVEGVIVSLSSGFPIDGQVRMEGNAPADYQLYVQMEPRGPAQWGAEGGQVKTGGSFSFAKVVEGEYRIMVHGMPGECYLKWAAFDGEGSSEAVVSITRDGFSPRLDILVSCSGGHIKGKVANLPQKISGALQVVLVPDADRADRQDLYKITSTDGRGNFSLDGIAPGDYKLYAWLTDPGASFPDPELAEAFESGGETVRVGENSTSHVELRLIQAKLPPN